MLFYSTVITDAWMRTMPRHAVCFTMVTYMCSFIMHAVDGNVSPASFCTDSDESTFQFSCPLQNGNEVTTIMVTSIFASHKASCSSDQSMCRRRVTDGDAFYHDVIGGCHWHRSCFLQSPQLQVHCPNSTSPGNYIQISYECVINGVTVPTTSTTARFTSPTVHNSPLTTGLSSISEAASTSTKATASSTAPEYNKTTTPATDPGENSLSNQTFASQDSGMMESSLVPTIVPLAVLLSLIIAIIILTLLYRKQRLPFPIQSSLDKAAVFIDSKLHSNRERRNKPHSKIPEKYQHSDNRIERSAENEASNECDIYCAIDEPSGYRYWNMGQSNDGFDSTENGKLPTMLVVPINMRIRAGLTESSARIEEVEDEVNDGYEDVEVNNSRYQTVNTSPSRSQGQGIRREEASKYHATNEMFPSRSDERGSENAASEEATHNRRIQLTTVNLEYEHDYMQPRDSVRNPYVNIQSPPGETNTESDYYSSPAADEEYYSSVALFEEQK